MRTSASLFLLAASLAAVTTAFGQSVDLFYSGVYSLRAITNLPGIPRPYGGVIVRTNNPNVLLIAGACGGASAKIYQLAVQRAADGHITNFTGSPTVFANTPGWSDAGNPAWTGLNGDWDFGPGGVLFYISDDNFLGQIKPGALDPAKQTDLLDDPPALSVGTVVSVPAGLPGAGRFKLGTRNHQFWFDVPLTSDGSGTYNLGPVAATVELVGAAVIGAAYVPAGAPKFTNASVVICDADRLRSYEVNGNGDPIPASGRTFVTGLDAPEGISRDPVTGDFIFTSSDPQGGFYVLGNFAPANPPTVTLTEPTNGTVFLAPASFFVAASASAPGGTVANVRLFRGTTLLSTVTTPPYETFVSGLAAGSYAFSAVVTDGSGRMATSAVATVSVVNPAANNPPLVALTNPVSGSSFVACRTVLLSASASDSDGYVQYVSFHDGTTLLGQVTNAPYRWPVNNLAGGAHALTARALDDDGAWRTSSVVNITIIAPPTNTLVATLGTNGQCEACFAGAAGSNYVFWGTTNLATPLAWRRVQTNSSPTGVIRFVDSASTNRPHGFYRAELLR